MSPEGEQPGKAIVTKSEVNASVEPYGSNSKLHRKDLKRTQKRMPDPRPQLQLCAPDLDTVNTP